MEERGIVKQKRVRSGKEWIEGLKSEERRKNGNKRKGKRRKIKG